MALRGLTFLTVLGLLSTLSASAAAQHLSPRFTPWDSVSATVTMRLPERDTTSRRDFRWLGTGIGATGLGIAAGLEAAAYCGNSENGPRDCSGLTISVGLLGTAVGGALGHLIGRAIPRH